MTVALFEDPLPPALAEQVDALLRTSADPSVLGYHRPAYQALLAPILGDRLCHLVATDAGGAPIGYLPFRERAAPPGRALCALPFFGPNGLVHAAPAAPPDTALRLVAAFREAAAGALSASLYTPFQTDVEPIAAALGAGDRIEKFNQFLDLAALERWPPKRRADIGRAHAAGLGVRLATRADLPALIELHRVGAAVAGAPVKPAAYLEAVFELALRAPDIARWTVADRGAGGPPIGCLLTLQGPRTMSYVLPAALMAERSNQPIPLLIDEAVGFARRCGIRYFNMESSPRLGDPVFKFKERWGALTGRYAVLVAYPRGRAAVEAIPEDELRAAYPYYFVRPFGAVGGAFIAPSA